MSTDVVMPQMGESIAEGTIVRWYKKVGESVEKEETLFEISTDKVDAEIPSPASGVLQEVLFEEGATVEVNTVVARIGDPAEAAAERPSPGDGAGAQPPKAGVSQQAAPVPGAAESAAEPPSREELRRTRSSPLVRRIAREHGVELSQIRGTGLSGRVTKRDILAYLERREAPPAAEGARLEPFSPMRRKIAEHMVASRDTSVHVTTVWEADFTRVARLRRAHQERYAERGVRLTYLPFIMCAVCTALREHPRLNASVVGEAIQYHPRVNLGVAVALEQGLIVPVVKGADELSLLGLARAVQDLAGRARAKKLDPEEVQGGTFTITNPGVFGSLFGTPIIHQPQVAILGVGAIQKRLVVLEDDHFAIRTMGYLALSFDHRIIDGAHADRFMARVREILEGFPEEAV